MTEISPAKIQPFPLDNPTAAAFGALLQDRSVTELESFYSIPSENVLETVGDFFKRAGRNVLGRKSTIGAEKSSRPITVYFDRNTFCHRRSPRKSILGTGVVPRLRYGSYGYPSVVAVKVNLDHLKVDGLQERFGDTETFVTKRMEIERQVDLSTFHLKTRNLIPAGRGESERIVAAYLQGRVDEYLNGAQLAPLFVTDSRRKTRLLSLDEGKGKVVCLELSLDRCRYYALPVDAEISATHGHQNAYARNILVNPANPEGTEINGEALTFDPQIELEYIPQQSKGRISFEDITQAEQRVLSVLKEAIGDVFTPKASKAEVGYREMGSTRRPKGRKYVGTGGLSYDQRCEAV